MIKKVLYIMVFSLSLFFLVSCGYQASPPSYAKPYLNKSMAFSNDLYIQEVKNWGEENKITFLHYDKNVTLKDATAPGAKQWKKVAVGQQSRIIGTVSKGTLFRVDDYKEPLSFSNEDPYVVIVVLNGPAKGIKGRIDPIDVFGLKTFLQFNGISSPPVKKFRECSPNCVSP